MDIRTLKVSFAVCKSVNSTVFILLTSAAEYSVLFLITTRGTKKNKTTKMIKSVGQFFYEERLREVGLLKP